MLNKKEFLYPKASTKLDVHVKQPIMTGWRNFIEAQCLTKRWVKPLPLQYLPHFVTLHDVLIVPIGFTAKMYAEPLGYRLVPAPHELTEGRKILSLSGMERNMLVSCNQRY